MLIVLNISDAHAFFANVALNNWAEKLVYKNVAHYYYHQPGIPHFLKDSNIEYDLHKFKHSPQSYEQVRSYVMTHYS